MSCRDFKKSINDNGNVAKGDFPLAEWNEISGKCFSHTPLGPGDGFRSCDV